MKSLHSKDMYKNVFSINKKIKVSSLELQNVVEINVCKVDLEEKSTITVFYSHRLEKQHFL